MSRRGAKPKDVDTTWTSELAYVVGVFASDGNLGKDGMYLEVTSVDKEIPEYIKAILNLSHIKIGRKKNNSGGAYRIQFKRVRLHQWFTRIGLTPNKSKTLGSIDVPDAYFFDFLRGVWDGDGSIYSFWDKRWRSSFMYYISFASASPEFLTWLQIRIRELCGVNGRISTGTRCGQLKYGKGETKIIFKRMFSDVNAPYLKRKFAKAQKIFTINERNSKRWNY